MRSLATRLAGKSFPRAAKYFALQNARCDDNATHVIIRARAACTSSGSATLEVAFRNPNVVARINRNRSIERQDLFCTGACAAQIDLVLVGAIRESAGACDRVQDRQPIAIRVFAALLEFAENVIRA